MKTLEFLLNLKERKQMLPSRHPSTHEGALILCTHELAHQIVTLCALSKLPA
jgi:hypothetical protein